MRYRFVDTLNIGIENLDLEALQFNSNAYSVLLYQHLGDFLPTPTKFGNSNNVESHRKFEAFIRLAKVENVSLAITPEYSCPWSVIRDILSNEEIQPSNGKLYAIGCESITRDELNTLENDFSNNERIIFFDKSVLNNNGNFFDPLCYIFRNQNRLYLIIQFKTHHMGVWTNRIESDHYKDGREIYILRNNPDSVYLFSLICSEAMNFEINPQFLNDVNNQWIGKPYIILNPQLNPGPNSHDFRLFYEKILVDFEQKDLICLNWANGSTVNGSPFIHFGRSGLFIKTHQIDFSSDVNFSANHLKGVYYLNNKRDIHSFYLCSYKPVFRIRCQKPITSGLPGVQLRKSEPIVEKVFDWVNNAYKQIITIDDSLNAFLDSHNCPSLYLRRADVSCVDKERLIILSSGLVKSSKRIHWHFVDNLFSYELDDTWAVKRATFLEDNEGDRYRIWYLESLSYLNVLLIKNEAYWPPILNLFRGNPIDEVKFMDGQSTSRYLYNFFSGENRATVICLNYERRLLAPKVLNETRNIFQEQSRNRVVVWYKTSLIGDNFDSITNEADLPITDLPVYDANSINRE